MLLDAVALFALGDLRKQGWYLRVWIPLLILSIIGSAIVLIGLVGALDAGSGEAEGFYGLGMVLIGGSSLPYPVLLLICLVHRPLRAVKP